MRRTDSSKIWKITGVVISAFCVLFITLLSRTPSLIRDVHLIPFWSYISVYQWKQVILNICLFVPLGYFLSDIFRRFSGSLALALCISLAVELLQFFTYRGTLDVDDLISNCLGAAVGWLLWKAAGRKAWEKQVAAVMIAAGFIGCIIFVVFEARSDDPSEITEQFDFAVTSVSLEDDAVNISGYCQTYDRAFPDYTLLLDGVPISTIVDGESFEAAGEMKEKKAELQIKFQGFQAMSTGVWLAQEDDDVRVEYVAADVNEPDDVPDTAVLKAYNAEYDVYVYQDDDRILWYIGWDELDSSTEIIYHLLTNTPQLLPANRVEFGFDNRGFRADSGKEVQGTGSYRVFEDIIPSEYNVTAILVGFRTNGMITWQESFRINR